MDIDSADTSDSSDSTVSADNDDNDDSQDNEDNDDNDDNDNNIDTLKELLAAIDAASEVDGQELKITSDISIFSDAIIIPLGKSIILTSDSEHALTTHGNYRHFSVSGTLTLSDKITLTNSSGHKGGGGVVVASGGVFTMDGGIIQNNGIIQDNPLSENPTNYGGGGVFIADGGTFDLIKGAITNNNAYSGGGVSVSGGGVFTMSGGTIDHNASVVGGGVNVNGTMSMTGGSIERNTSNVAGGVNVEGTLNMASGKISNNNVTHTIATIPISTHDGGGGVRVYNNGKFVMYGDAEISNNTAPQGGGGVILIGSSTPGIGGRFFMYGNASIRDNTVTGEGSEEFKNACNGGGVCVLKECVFTMLSGEISGNEAASGEGGGVFVADGGAFDMKYGVFSDGGGEEGIALNSIGLSVAGGTISGNSAYSGGGVFSTGAFTIDGGGIVNNSSRTNGGGVYSKGQLTINDAKICGNNSEINGGGMYSDGAFTIDNGDIRDNTAGADGGGVYSIGAFTMNNGSIRGNTAGADGGGVYSAGDSTIAINQGVISGNIAANDGGGIWIPHESISRLTVEQDVEFSNNAARAVYERDMDDDGVYYENIHATTWTSPSDQGYNNIDISYTYISGTIRYMVRFIDWDEQELKSGYVVSGEDATPPQDPAREGYTFTGWSGDYLNVTSDLTITALYSQIPNKPQTYKPNIPPQVPADPEPEPTPEPEPEPELIIEPTIEPTIEPIPEPLPTTVDYVPEPDPVPYIPIPPIFPWQVNDMAVDPEPNELESFIIEPYVTEPEYIQPIAIPEAKIEPKDPISYPDPITIFEVVDTAPGKTVLERIKLDGIPIISILDREIPVAGGTMYLRVWSLTNLLLSIAGIAFAVIICIRVIRHWRRLKNSALEGNYQAATTTKHSIPLLPLTVVALGIAGIVVFFFTQDMRKLMVLVDKMSLLHLSIFLSGMLSFILTIRYGKYNKV